MMTSEKKPHVAFYMHTVFNGGIERVLFNLATELMARGIRVDLVVNHASGSPFMKQVPFGVRVVDLGIRRFMERLPLLMSYLRKEKPDTLLSTHHFSNEIAVLATKLARTGTRIVVSEHTTLSVELSAASTSPLRRWGIPLLARFAYRGADAIVTVSYGSAKDLARLIALPAVRIETIYNPVLTPDILEKSRAPVGHPWFNDVDCPVILGVGRLETQKNFANLINAFAEIRRTHDAKLVILGEGSLRAELQEQINSLNLNHEVDMPGFVENPFAYIARAKVFALSSTWEGLPTVLIESLALGTPVVSTDCPSGPREILDGGRLGLLVPVNNPKLLAGAISNALSSPIDLSSAGDWLRQFTPESVVERYIRIMGLQTS